MAVPSSKNWLKKRCLPCEGGRRALSKTTAVRYLKSLKDWYLSSDARMISADYLMKDFLSAVDLIRRISTIAEKEDHHPDIHLTGYRRLRIDLSTHAIGGLSENDFILAAKITKLPKKLKESIREAR